MHDRARSLPRRSAPALAFAFALALVAGACSSGDATTAGADTPIARADGSAFAADALLPLSLERGDNARIVDSDGRQVLLRGANLNTLGEILSSNPVWFGPIRPSHEARPQSPRTTWRSR